MSKRYLAKAVGSSLALATSSAMALSLAIAITPVISTAVQADASLASIARGGLLYDKWFKVTGAELSDETHEAYPSDAKKAGDTTWRCKECHGWDYKGVDGAYGSGSHQTGIKGVWDMRGADPADIIAIIQDDTHGMADMMEDADYEDLANFVSAGLVDMSEYIDYSTKQPIGGDVDNGAAIFNTTCARCHREDGRRPKDMEHPLGLAVADNPQEVLHKILNGHPGQNMPAFRVFGKQVAVDVLTYLETLPQE